MIFAIKQILLLLPTRNGGLAQLARALAWHARGHRFDSDILHLIIKALRFFVKPFFFMGLLWVYPLALFHAPSEYY
jgi:hypothetical protein